MPHNNSNKPIKNNLNFWTITQYKFRRCKDVILYNCHNVWWSLQLLYYLICQKVN